jgi:sulfur-oxidizing protein SoxX
MRILFTLCAVIGLGASASAQQAQPQAKVSQQVVDAYVKQTWTKVQDGWQSRVDQDETQRICSVTRNSPSTAESDAILAREKASVKFPADGNVLGDWKRGATVANRGTGGQFTDKADTYRGGNCYACHQMAKEEVSYGTLGPSLTNYGKERKFDKDEARQAYAKIYNAQSVLPCSQMPRFGYHQFLTEQQIKDVVAYLFDPASPVNK